MASVTVTIPNSSWSVLTAFIQWNPPNTEHLALGSALSVGAAIQLFWGILIFGRANGEARVQLSDGTGAAEVVAGPDFSLQMENFGTLEFVASNGDSLTLTGIVDATEPYQWTPTNSAEVMAFAEILVGLTDRSLTVTLNDNVATTPPLALSDFDDIGLEVETAALLEASAPGTSINNFYADSSRGGSGVPIEGELGVGPAETVISRMRRASTENLTLNDNNLPVQLSFDTFFGIDGDGEDLTLYLQTASDGLVSFTVASTFLSAGGNWLNVTLPIAARTLLDNLATGDRFIFALARATPLPITLHVVTAVFPGEEGSFVAAVTKVAARLLSAAVVFPGAVGSFSASVSKSIYNTLAASAVFPGTGGSLTAAVTKIPARFIPVAVGFPGIGGNLSVAINKAPYITLAAATIFSGTGGSFTVSVIKIAPTKSTTLFDGQYTTPIELACEKVERGRMASFSLAPFTSYEKIDSSMFPSIALFNGLPVTILTLPPEVRANLLNHVGLLFDISGTREAINVAAFDLGMFINPIIEEIGGERVVTLIISQPVYAISEEAFTRFITPLFEDLILPWTLPLREIGFGHTLVDSIGLVGRLEYYERESVYEIAINS